MKNNIRIPVVLLIAVLCLSMSACCMKHTFSASTCAAPGVCSKCGKTSDEPLADHTWKKASCTAPKTCTVCGRTEGEPLGHTWAETSCTAPKTCTVCGKTEGEPLGHSFGAWKAQDPSVLGGKQTRTCSVCGDTESRVAPREKAPAATVLTTKGLAMSCADFAQYLLSYLPEEMYIDDLTNDQFYIKTSSTVWSVHYIRDASAPYKSRIEIMGVDRYAITKILPYLYDAITPSITGSERANAEAMIDNAFDNGTNGIYAENVKLGDLRCTLFYIPGLSDYPLLTFCTAKFADP